MMSLCLLSSSKVGALKRESVRWQRWPQKRQQTVCFHTRHMSEKQNRERNTIPPNRFTRLKRAFKNFSLLNPYCGSIWSHKAARFEIQKERSLIISVSRFTLSFMFLRFISKNENQPHLKQEINFEDIRHKVNFIIDTNGMHVNSINY